MSGWFDSVTPTGTAPRVAVVGLGTMGALALLNLASQGIQAEGFDQFAVGHPYGAAGGGTRIFRMVYAEGSEYLPFLETSRTVWSTIAERTGWEVLRRNGCLTIGAADSVQIRRSLIAAEDSHLDYELIDAEQMPGRFSAHPLAPNEVGFFDPAGGVLRSDRAIIGAARLAVDAGAVVHQYARVTAVERSGAGVDLVVDGERRHFDAAIVATGPWATSLIEESGIPLVVRHVRASFHIPVDNTLLDPANFPSVMRRAADGRSYGGMSALDGNAVKFVIQHSGADESVDLSVPFAPTGVDLRYLEELRTLVADLLPSVHPDPVNTASHVEGFTPDGEGVIGFSSESERIVIMTGFSGHGFKMAPALAESAVDLLLGAERHPVLARLDPERFTNPSTTTDTDLGTLWFDVGNGVSSASSEILTPASTATTGERP